MFPGFTCPCTSGKCRTAVRQKFSDADMSKKKWDGNILEA